MRGVIARAARTGVSRALSLATPVPPGWVDDWIGAAPRRAVGSPDGLLLEVRDGAEACLARAVVRGARELRARELRRAVESAYTALAAILIERGLAPLRMWNYVPAIRARASGGLSRYEVFNLGRYLAVSEWLAPESLGARLPAASAIDHHGADLEVHVLAGRAPGVALENPRQTPAWRYSARYGPLPPCFVRALRVAAPGGASELVLVSGTASIVGEDSRHDGDLDGQLDETFRNLAALAATFSRAEQPALARYRALRAYVVRGADAGVVARRVREAFPALDALELYRADLCRPELLVEIEGVAHAEARA